MPKKGEVSPFKGTITPKSQLIIDAMLKLIEEFSPRTLRAYYYQLVVLGLFPNNQDSYNNLKKLTQRTRENGMLPYDAFTDSSRPHSLDIYDNGIEHYIRTLPRYHSDWWRDQEQRIVLWIEKDALMNIVQPIANRYHVDLYCGKGDSSITSIYNAARRIGSGEESAYTTVLYLGDFDPKGIQIAETLFNSMKRRHNCYPKQERIAINYDQALDLEKKGLSNLVKDATAKGDSHAQIRGAENYNAKAQEHRDKYGDLSVELDAFSPKQLQDLVENAIKQRCDLDLLLQREEDDRIVTARIKQALAPLTVECEDYE